MTRKTLEGNGIKSIAECSTEISCKSHIFYVLPQSFSCQPESIISSFLLLYHESIPELSLCACGKEKP